jgi:peptidoglycan hydrolase CwlO-like protein
MNFTTSYDLIEHFSSKSHIKKLGLFYKYQRPNTKECRRREEFFIAEEVLEKFKAKCEELVKKNEKKDEELGKSCNEISTERNYIERTASDINDRFL